MTDQRSPWATPETEIVVTGAAPASPQPPANAPSYGPANVPAARPASRYGPGTVTNLGPPGVAGGDLPPPDVISGGRDDDDDDDEDPTRRNQRMLRKFMVGAAAILAIGLVVVLAMVMTGRTGGPGVLAGDDKAKGPSDVAPPLARRCPPPSDPVPRPPGEVPATPPGPRTVDADAGISYRAYGEPWTPWDQVWTAGDLNVRYAVGQHFVTERYGGGDYHASILSASVPATVNDALVLDLKCTGQQVAADVRGKYYPQPNQVEMIRDEQVDLGGRQAWVTKFRLHFSAPGLQAKDELVAIALIDVGRPEAAILYVSIPGTHRQHDSVVDEVLDSVRPG
ncbi:MAG TPA: hypothetical protein VK453_20235 [Micromonosporaceae bacterium]|nr:hypothetical protein [Micromonosporaceae bacterium]